VPTTIGKKKYMPPPSAEGTDGSNPDLCLAHYKVIDGDGFAYDRVSIQLTIHNAGVSEDIDAALVAVIDGT